MKLHTSLSHLNLSMIGLYEMNKHAMSLQLLLLVPTYLSFSIFYKSHSYTRTDPQKQFYRFVRLNKEYEKLIESLPVVLYSSLSSGVTVIY